MDGVLHKNLSMAVRERERCNSKEMRFCENKETWLIYKEYGRYHYL